MHKQASKKQAITRPPKFIGQLPEHKISFAFQSAATKYYQFDEGVFFLPFRRGLMAAAYYKELQCGVDREYLLWHVAEFKKIFSNSKEFDISRMAILNKQLQERLDFIFDPDIIYKLASVVFFDESENPYQYNIEYGQKKVAKWKASESVADFFLRHPIRKLVPFLGEQEQSILTYLEVSQKIKDLHSKNLLSPKSKNFSTSPSPTS